VEFVLVHGAYHGVWCWDRLRPELEARGHAVIAVDLPISTPGLGAADYAGVVAASMADLADPVLVGHSMAGLVIPLVPPMRRVRRLVFLAGFLPQPGVSSADQRATEPIDPPIAPTTAQWTDLGDDVWMVGPDTATEIFYHDASPELARWATARLRPQCYRVIGEPSPLAAWPSVESRYIVSRDDHAINPDWGRMAARDRLGVDALELDGGHSPFLTRPAELADVLERASA
jgi:hypothetical protein